MSPRIPPRPTDPVLRREFERAATDAYSCKWAPPTDPAGAQAYADGFVRGCIVEEAQGGRTKACAECRSRVPGWGAMPAPPPGGKPPARLPGGGSVARPPAGGRPPGTGSAKAAGGVSPWLIGGVVAAVVVVGVGAYVVTR
jgi:hypothetical protein